MTRMLENLRNTMDDLQEQQAVIEEEINVIGQQIQDLEERIQSCRFRLGVVAEDRERVLTMKDRYSSGNGESHPQSNLSKEAKKAPPEPAKATKSSLAKPDLAKTPAKGQLDKSFMSSSLKAKEPASHAGGQAKDNAKLSLNPKKDASSQTKGNSSSSKSQGFTGKSTAQFSKLESKAPTSGFKSAPKDMLAPPTKEEPQTQPSRATNELKEPQIAQRDSTFTPPSFIYSAANVWDSQPSTNDSPSEATESEQKTTDKPTTDPLPSALANSTVETNAEVAVSNQVLTDPATTGAIPNVSGEEPAPDKTQQPDTISQTTIDLGSSDEKSKDDDTVKSINDALRGLFR